jgi:hypothetical protein
MKSESFGYDDVSRDNISRRSGKACIPYPQGQAAQQNLFHMHLNFLSFSDTPFTTLGVNTGAVVRYFDTLGRLCNCEK